MNKKSAPLLILKILQQFSDENHLMTQQDIIDKLQSLYDLKLERKSVSSSIKLLQDLDYDIIKTNKGCAYIDRVFEESEVQYIIDLLLSSKSITGSYALQIADKLKNTLSENSKQDYNYIMESKSINRTNNKEIFLNIETIKKAIKNNKWIGFQYLTYDEDGKQTLAFNNYVYHASPCFLINNQGRYYLLAQRNKYKNINIFRVDYMKNIYEMDDRQRIPINEVDEFKSYKNISDYINDHIYPFGGKIIHAIIEVFNPRSLTYVNDWFGTNAKIYKKDNRLFAKIKCNEKAFFYWAMQYSEHIRVVSPKEMIENIKKAAEEMLKKYN